MMSGRRVVGLVVRRSYAHSTTLRPVSLPQTHPLRLSGVVTISQRTYATPGRPRTAVGEPSKPVKRAAKKTATTTTTAKKTKAKAKAKKPAAKKKPKKELPEEQKAKRQANKAKAEIRELKKTALSPPPNNPVNAYQVFVKSSAKKGISLPEAQAQMKELAAQFKTLSASDREHYNRLAIDETQSKQSEYKSWVSSRPVEEIAMANSARAKLRRRLVTKRSAWKKIEDERAGKPRVSSYAAFVVERHASGDLKDIAFSERSKLLSQEWKALDASEKKKYSDLSSSSQSEFADSYGSPQQAASAA